MSQFQVCVCVSSCKHYVDLSGCILLHTVICFALSKLPCKWQISRRDIPLLFTFAEMSQFMHHHVQCQAHALCDSHCFHVFITSWLSSTSGEIQTCPAAAPRSVEPSTCRGKFSNHFIGWRASCMGCAAIACWRRQRRRRRRIVPYNGHVPPLDLDWHWTPMCCDV